MKKQLFKTMKVFDCQDMPTEIKNHFFELSGEVGNDCYVDWWIHDERFFYKAGQEEDENYCHYVKCKQSIENWLIKNGAEGAKNAESSGEHVIIKRWW